jgi:SpoIID/LytB domain protein
MELSVSSLDSKGKSVTKSLGKTKSRIYVNSLDTRPIYIKSLRRANGHRPVYYGSLEVFIKDSNMRLINEVDLEKYLMFVVPSEMLPTGGIEAYKTQAVISRTYALSDMLAGRFASQGFHVDDTTLSQAYNLQPSLPECNKAIEETKGEVITYDNKIIDAKYYSTSCGLGAPFNEIYYNGMDYNKNNPEPYLVYNDYTNSKIDNLYEEEKASVFMKDWTVKSYDSNSPYFRWKYTMDKKTLNTTINKNIYNRYMKNPTTIRKKWYFNIYRQTKISSEGIGNIVDISISKRGSAGNVMEMIVKSDTGVYKIIGETGIKRILTPDNLEITPLYGKAIKNVTSLPSPYFILDKQFSSDKIKNLTVYGGGFGHGVGLSQYGAIGLVHQGKTYQDIIKIYYKDINFTDYKEALSNSL